MPQDTQIVHRVIQGDVQSFRVLVERYQVPLLGLVCNLLGDSNECEDIAQDVFLAAYANLATYDASRAKFSTWLFTIARNKCFNAIKKRKPIVTDSLPESADVRTPDDQAAENEWFRQLDAALDRLPYQQKAAFVLSEIQGLSLREIGRIEGVRLGTVKSRISRAKQKLRDLFTPMTESH